MGQIYSRIMKTTTDTVEIEHVRTDTVEIEHVRTDMVEMGHATMTEPGKIRVRTDRVPMAMTTTPNTRSVIPRSTSK